MISMLRNGVLAASIAFGLGAHAANSLVDVNSLQKILLQKHATWTAKDSWVNHLSRDQIKHLLGARHVQKTDVEFTIPSKNLFSAMTPASFDWRNVNGADYVSPILDQGNCGSCVAFATIGTLETQENITAQFPGLNQRFSPQALFACGGGTCDEGWEPEDAAEYVQQTGVPDEACAPYTSGATGQDVSCSSICPDAAQRSIKADGITRPTQGSQDIDAVKKALAHGPLTTTLTVYADFLTYASGVYQHTTGPALGGHAVSIVGYDDSLRAWIVRNSWGESWGDHGFVLVSYDDISGVSDETWGFDLPTQAGYVKLSNLADRQFVSGAYQINAESTFQNPNSLSITVVDPSNHTVAQGSYQASTRGSLTLDTSQLADGMYQAYATASWGDNMTSVSQHNYFYVINHVPAMKIDLSGGDTDLTQPLSGRVAFNIKADSGAVPFQDMHFYAKSGGKVLVDHPTQDIANQMQIGWRTDLTPNGAYEVWVAGDLTVAGHTYTVESQHLNVQVQN